MKALLILVGGRPIPNVLTALHEKPETIIAVCSHESFQDEWIQLKQAITNLAPASQIKETPTVDAFDIQGIKETCINAFLMYPKADWVFNVTTATSLMTVGAYMAAEVCINSYKSNIACLFLDTAHSRPISITGEKRDASIFSLEVKQYVGAYNYGLQSANSIKNYESQYLQSDWMAFARRLGKHPEEIALLKQILKSKHNKNIYNITKEIFTHQFLQEMARIGLIRKLREEESSLQFYLSDEQLKFLNGVWLELYVFQEARDIGFFDDITWSKEIIDNDPNRTAKNPLAFKEIDVAVTHKAHFMIIECKTGDEGLDLKTLDDIVTIADLIGRGFVTKVLVTSKSLSDPQDQTTHEGFKTKARVKGIQVLSLEDLPQIGDRLKGQMEKAMSSRR